MLTITPLSMKKRRTKSLTNWEKGESGYKKILRPSDKRTIAKQNRFTE